MWKKLQHQLHPECLPNHPQTAEVSCLHLYFGTSLKALVELSFPRLEAFNCQYSTAAQKTSSGELVLKMAVWKEGPHLREGLCESVWTCHHALLPWPSVQGNDMSALSILKPPLVPSPLFPSDSSCESIMCCIIDDMISSDNCRRFSACHPQNTDAQNPLRPLCRISDPGGAIRVAESHQESTALNYTDDLGIFFFL